MLQEESGEQAASRPGRQYVLDADYFRRIDAMHFVLAHDDGQAQAGIAEADVVLVGVSRSSKTPTSFYLANRGGQGGQRAAGARSGGPAGPGCADLPGDWLTLDPPALIEIRRHRLRMIAHGGPMRHDSVDYIDQDAVKDELLWARRLCNRRGWPVIDVTRRSIEETAATVAAAHGGMAQPPAARRSRRMMRPDAPPIVLASGSATRRLLMEAAGCGSRRGRSPWTRRPSSRRSGPRAPRRRTPPCAGNRQGPACLRSGRHRHRRGSASRLRGRLVSTSPPRWRRLASSWAGCADGRMCWSPR